MMLNFPSKSILARAGRESYQTVPVSPSTEDSLSTACGNCHVMYLVAEFGFLKHSFLNSS